MVELNKLVTVEKEDQWQSKTISTSNILILDFLTNEKNLLKKLYKQGKPIVNGWLQIPSSFSAEVMAHEGWDHAQ